MSGASDGRYVAVFDYQYVTGHGKSTKTWRTTVALLQSDGALIHRFSLRPKGTWDKISGLFGSAAIDFHHRPQFSRSYVLRGENEPGIRAMFTEPVLDYFEQRAGISAEGMIHTLLFYRPGKHVSPADVPQFLADAFEAQSLFRVVPQSVARS
jgi:hypothetical protein